MFGVSRAARRKLARLPIACCSPFAIYRRLTATMIVLRLVLGLAALGLLHSVIFASVPLGARERARRDRH